MLALTAPTAAWHVVFLLVALVLFALATFNVPARVNFIAAGLAVVTALYLWIALAHT